MNQYLYDGDGRICAVASTTVPGTNAMIGYIYDADGLRVAKGTITQWSCDPSVSGFATVSDFVLGPGGEQVAEYGAGPASGSTPGALVWQHSNINAAGTITDTYDYDAFGNEVNHTGATPNNYLYRAEQYDSDLGLYYLRARYYNPVTGRFLSRDPKEYEPTNPAKYDPFKSNRKPTDPRRFHKYLYAGGDPVNLQDPRGRAFFEDGAEEEFDPVVEEALRRVAFATCVEEMVEAFSVQELYMGYSLAELELLAIEECSTLYPAL